MDFSVRWNDAQNRQGQIRDMTDCIPVGSRFLDLPSPFPATLVVSERHVADLVEAAVERTARPDLRI